jgi:hypothetical protein
LAQDGEKSPIIPRRTGSEDAQLRNWFELFAGMTVYRPKDGTHVSDGWLNTKDVERRFSSENLRFGGRRYDASDTEQQNQLLDAIIHNAGLLCTLRLLERRHQLRPPSLDYRVTPLGRRIDAWGY